MTLSDITLLLKKILIGIVIAVIPFIILFGGILLMQKLLSEKSASTITVKSQAHETRTSNP